MKGRIATAFSVLIIFFSTAHAQKRIGHINSDDVIRAMPEFNQVKVELDSLKEAYQVILYGMHAESDNLEKQLQYHDETIPDSVQGAKLKKLRELRDAMKDMENKASDEMEQARDEKMDALKAKYLQAVAAVARTKGYAYIFDLASDAVVYVADNKNDITEAVYKYLGVIPPSMTTDTTTNILPGLGGK